ncbi:hypothetical protein F5Y00DRAFT_147309 [Daldinia vernicosa]|uniref:uncharacterized protein n=1 Tax=Daldinia vernicosa TaxID=114800 RepID=UPI00200761C5|nr:uncharacterized protein F5Y00DRAFT_147309 [Daldinia vernicosa]KAI0846199.1 hypothetical protein F5Y00DRAFT_147309 [Daldinia vernicosa]
MSDFLTTGEAHERETREALDKRQPLVDEFLQELDGAGPPSDRTECEREMEKIIERRRRIDRDLKKKRKVLEKRAAAANEFIDSMKDDSGRIERERLLTHLENLDQSIFQHALLVVAAHEKDPSFIRNLSAGHREALSILDHRSVEDHLSDEISQKKKALEEASVELAKQKQELAEKDRELMKKTDELKTARAEVVALKAQIGEKDESILGLKASKNKANDLANDLFDQITRKTGEAVALTSKLDQAEHRLSELNKRIPQLEDHIKDRELRLAKFFAAQSSCEGNDYGG